MRPWSAPRGLEFVANVKIGQAPSRAEMAEDGRTCLLTNGRSNDLSFVSIADRAEVARVPVGRGPRHVSVAPVPADVLAAVAGRTAS